MPKDPKRVAAGKKSKAKGRRLETKLCKIFADFWDPIAEWRPTPMSGGSMLKSGWDLAGDICTTSPDWPWSVEAKHQECLPHLSVLFNMENKGAETIKGWWDQAVEDTPPHRWPLLVFTKNYHPVMVMFHKDALPDKPMPKFVPIMAMKWRHSNERCYIMSLDSFLALGKGYWKAIPDRPGQGNGRETRITQGQASREVSPTGD